MAKYPFENMVFKGGGVKAQAYVGVIRVLDEKYDVLKNIKRMAGGSSGAIFATIVAISEGHKEVKAIMDDLDFQKVQQKEPDDFPAVLLPVKHLLDEHFGDAFCIHRLINNYGYYSTEYFHDWMKEKIHAAYMRKTGRTIELDYKITFKEFYEVFQKDLVLFGTNVSRHKSFIFSKDHTPDMEVSFAVRVSMSIPLYFETQEFEYPGEGTVDYFGDGGVMRNYPLNVFDVDDVPNYKTLGCLLVVNPTENPRTEIKDVMDFGKSLFETFVAVQDDHYRFFNDTQKNRTCYIDDLGISTYKFNLSKGDKDALEKSGEEAIETFIKGYNERVKDKTEIVKN